MSELSDPELDDFDRSLLKAGCSDSPASGAAVRAAAALGLAVTAAAPAAAAAATAGVAARTLALTGSKWTLIGALGIASVGTGTVAYLRAADPTPPAVRAPSTASEPRAAEPRAARDPALLVPEAAIPPPPATPPSPAGQTASARRSSPTEPPETHGAAPPATHPLAPNAVAPSPPASPAAATPGTATAAAAPDGVSIAEEVAAVDRARHSLRQGRAGEALDELNRYQARWPKGTLATEVVVLRVEAELRLGRRAAAKERAKAFIATQPSSRYAARVRELFGPGELE